MDCPHCQSQTIVKNGKDYHQDGTGFFFPHALTHQYHEQYGLYFSEPIGYLIKVDGSQTPLYYGEIKIVKKTGEYHEIPRTSPCR